MADLFKMRFVTVGGVRYYRADDVAGYVRDLASTEETDDRTRFYQAARNLEKASGPR